jgi:hypothetical protein
MTITMLSFYCDDTNPYCAPPEAFKAFLDFVEAEGIAGESSAILAFEWLEHGVLSRPSTEVDERYIEQLQRAYTCGIDTHCELMTHSGRFDFAGMRIPERAIHEGVWLHEPEVSTQEYEDYFGHILTEGERIGVRFTGVTWPGCGCEPCTRRYQELREAGITDPNPNFWQALLRLAQQGRFRGKTVPCFFGGALEQCADRVMARDGEYAIFDLPPNAHDRFGLWLNSAAEVNADYYITADGRAGRIIDLVRASAPYVLFYAHWQGLNPVNGVGWKAFTQVVGRVKKYLGDQVEWLRPSELTQRKMKYPD